MITAAAFVVAGAAGALARAEAGRRWNRHDGPPVGTLVVNVTGSFLVGLLSEVTPPVFTVVGVAGLGTYTTFSSFARDTLSLVETNKAVLAAGYVLASCFLSIAGAALGVGIAAA